METENADELASSTASTLLPLASAAQQPYVSELLSFTLDRLNKVICESISSVTCCTRKWSGLMQSSLMFLIIQSISLELRGSASVYTV